MESSEISMLDMAGPHCGLHKLVACWSDCYDDGNDDGLEVLLYTMVTMFDMADLITVNGVLVMLLFVGEQMETIRFSN